LTIRRTVTSASLVLHRHDAAEVAHVGGLYQVILAPSKRLVIEG